VAALILSNGAEALTQLAQRARIPVTMSLMGLGGFPGSDPLWLGMIGMHGTYRANMSLGECDLLIGIGVRFDDRVTGKTDTFAAQGENRPHRYRPHLHPQKRAGGHPVVGDCKISLEALNNAGSGEEDRRYRAGCQSRTMAGSNRRVEKHQPLAYDQGEEVDQTAIRRREAL
jgi:acetolactate synthase-1/2/3 large subunit